MNSKTYLKNIAHQFGGCNYDRLESALKKFRQMIIAEEYERKSGIKLSDVEAAFISQPTVRFHQELNLDVDIPPEHVAITPTEYCGKSEYNLTMRFILEKNYKGWYSMGDIPVELFPTFMIIADLHPEIIFDHAREDQYFKIDGFKKRSLIED